MRNLRFVSGWIFVLVLAAPGFLPAAGSGGSDSPPETLHQRLEALDRRVQAHLRRVARQAAAGEAVDPDLLERAQGFLEQLAALEHAARGEEGAAAYEGKIRQLRLLVGNLEKSGREGASVAVLPRDSVQPVVSGPVFTKAVPANDDCANAIAIGFGTYTGDTSGATNDASASCGASLFSPDVWFKYTATGYSNVSVDTFGSSYDTVLSVYGGCPVPTASELTCNDDAFGLQSAVSFYAYPGEEYRIRVSGFDGASGAFQLRLGEGGTISGTVTDAATGDPLPGGVVDLRGSAGFYTGSTLTDATGKYTLESFNAASYFVVTSDFPGFVGELYDDVVCPGAISASCVTGSGTPVPGPSLGDFGGVDFELDRGGLLGGTVTSSVGGTPIADVRVETYHANGSQVATDYTAADGTYLVDSLAGGDYFVVAESAAHQDKVFDDMACPGGTPYGCDPTSGTPVTVEMGMTSGGIDFVLDELGSISGVVTSTGAPATNVSIQVYRKESPDDYSYAKTAYSDETGTYTAAGLSPGIYAVRTDDHGTYVNEVYDDVTCCDLSAGTQIAIVLNAPATGIDFDLDRLGKISGTVTDAITGDPIASVGVAIRSPTGGWFDSAQTNASGQYRSDGLSAGSYVVQTNINEYGSYLNELYNELPCASETTCDLPSGTPVPVVVNQTTSGVDFTLDQGGVISGRVTDSSGNPVPGYYEIYVFNATETRWRHVYTNSTGYYTVIGLFPDTYYVLTSGYEGLFDELYDDVPCEPSCDRTTGTPLTISRGEQVTGIDFVLERLGSISGTLSDSSGNPIAFHGIDVYDEMGALVTTGGTNSTGAYRVDGLLPGTYYVETGRYSSDDFFDELYDDLPCELGCNPMTGTPVAVVLNQETSGVDFVLERLASVTGSVFDEDTGEPLSGVEIQAWAADGSILEYDYTDADGHYVFGRIPPGTCYVRTAYAYYDGYLDELFSDIPCLAGYSCDPTKGSPVPTFLNTTTENVSFALRASGSTPRGTGGLQGTVDDAVQGVPLLGVLVDVWDAAGIHVATVVSDAAGRYDVSLAPGSYFVSTDNRRGFVDEAYDGVLCPGGPASTGGCDPTLGTAVSVGGVMTTGIDFALAGKWEIFADGFESGDVSRWSSAVGTVP